MEQRGAHMADRLLTVSDDEQHYFEGIGARGVKVIPNGVDCSAFQELPTGRSGQPPLILYLGNMSWGPNIGAAAFLSREVLPRLRERNPDARLRIVGRSPVREVKALADTAGVEVIGDVPDIKPHLREARVLAVPLDSGGGTRLKILEAFAAGLPVISTPIGCEGLGVSHGEHLLIANRGCFADAITMLLDDDECAVQLVYRARALAWRSFDWSIVGQAACAVVDELASSRQNTDLV
jgi:glycosyltransferase involved in cell wall biosynthesis